ncbi:glutamine synthetase family protein [Pseudomonas sp. AP-1]|uniref:glutamine synthetase family protein n=1 Tax=Pseudomonas sp. AP-1 TaxID=3231718 RepID=UPI0035B44943
MGKKFVEQHGLWSDVQRAAALEVLARIEKEGIQIIRLSWPDQWGLLRGKSLTVEALKSAFASGSEVTMAPFLIDTASAIFVNPFVQGGGLNSEDMSGIRNLVMVPDPTTFKVLPWADRTGWLLADLHMRDGRPFPLSPRAFLKKALAKLSEKGLTLNAGLEVEFYLTRIVDPCLDPETIGEPGMPAEPPKVMPIAKGFSYLLENHLDEVEPIVAEIRSHLLTLGLPLRSIEDEWAPSQLEMTFDVLPGLELADTMVLFRNAVKQIARRRGYLASFMCRPAIPGFFPSGWHLHQSLADSTTGENLFVPKEGEPISDLGRAWVGGLLEHAVAASSFTTPTINGYRRRRPNSMAPDRVAWALDNRAAMVRVIAGPGDSASRVENRVGEPAANPYLYLTSQILAGLDGIERNLDPGAPQDTPYLADVQTLPINLSSALDELENSTYFTNAFGEQFIHYWIKLQRSVWERFVAAEGNVDMQTQDITKWEHREYFELM